MTLEWEEVDQKPALSGYMRRASVPGGWIYHCVEEAPMYDGRGSLEGGFAWRSSMCFVPTHSDEQE